MKRIKIILLVCTMFFSILRIADISECDAADMETDTIVISSAAEAVVTNADGETIIVNKDGSLSGTMDILKESPTDQSPLRYVLTVRSSNSYHYEKKEKVSTALSIINDEGRYYVKLRLDNKGDACFEFDSVGEIDVNAPAQKYELVARMMPNGGSYTLQGRMSGKISIVETGNQLIVNGAKGKTSIAIMDSDLRTYLQGSYYLFGHRTVLGRAQKIGYIKNAVRLPDKTADHPIALYLRPVNGGKAMALSWRKVKRAKSYVVYGYDKQLKKYRKEAVRNGFETNYYITASEGTQKYRYKVMAKGGRDGNGKQIGKLSYDVSATPLSGNAAKVKINAPNTLKVKRGQAKKLRATAVTKEKPLYDSSIRWYSSDTKIVKADEKSGRMVFQKKGICYVWAKAHNGINSKRIKVRVR